MRLFRNVEAAGGTTRDRRRMLERIADQLGDLELELSYSVEATADLGLLVPSLRVESFHNALYESMSLASKAVTAGRMLERLARAIDAELTAIESIERRADDNRRIRYAVAVGFVSAVAIPASLILAYLGINASQVNSARSMFSHHYLGMYLTIAGLIVVAVAAVSRIVAAAAPRRPPAPHRRPATQVDHGPRRLSDLTPLPDPSPALGRGPSRETARNAEPLHDRRDIPADRRDADAQPPRDDIVAGPSGHHFQHRLLGRRQPVPGCCGPIGGDRRGALPEQLEVLAQRADDHRCPDQRAPPRCRLASGEAWPWSGRRASSSSGPRAVAGPALPPSAEAWMICQATGSSAAAAL